MLQKSSVMVIPGQKSGVFIGPLVRWFIIFVIKQKLLVLVRAILPATVAEVVEHPLREWELAGSKIINFVQP